MKDPINSDSLHDEMSLPQFPLLRYDLNTGTVDGLGPRSFQNLFFLFCCVLNQGSVTNEGLEKLWNLLFL